MYPNILKDKIPIIQVNEENFDGVFLYENSVLNYKNLGGILLAKLNHINLEVIQCNHCHKYHSDNGKFAYTPHSTHFCQYCGHLFRVKEKNIGNEFDLIYDIPNIQLENKKINIDSICRIEYELLSGSFYVNGQNGNIIVYEGKQINLVDFMNQLLKDEF